MRLEVLAEIQENSMDYSKIIEELKKASLFDLYRLSVAINQLFYYVNLDEVNTDIIGPSKMGLDKSQLKVGDIVGFQDKQNNDVHGKIIRLNQKTATIKTNTNTEWRVGYEWLYVVIDVDQRNPHLIEGRIIDEKKNVR